MKLRSPITLLLSTAIAASAVAGCATAEVSSTRTTHFRANPIAVNGPSVPAGTRFTARLESTVDTEGSYRGQSVAARLDRPLLDATGRVVVPAGARLVGHVASLGTFDAPRIRVAFDALDTGNRSLPIAASLRRAEHASYAGPRVYRTMPMYDFYSSYAFAQPYGNWGTGGGPQDFNEESLRPREVHLDRGATLEFVLTRPLVAP